VSVVHSSAKGRGNPPLRRLEVVALVVPSALLSGLVALDFFVLEPLLPPVAAHLLMLVVGLGGVITFSLAIFSRLADLQARLARQNDRLVRVTHDLQRRSDQLRALSSAGTVLSSEHSVDGVLQKVVDLAREVAEARYAALVTFDDDGQPDAVHTSGLGTIEWQSIAARPERSRNRLEVVLAHRDRRYGVLYLVEKAGADDFSAADEEAVITLATKASIAIENAHLLEQVEAIAALEQRNRIGIDLHDGAMQSLYGVSLVIEDAAGRLASDPIDAESALRKAVDRLNATIADLRAYVLGLKPVSMEGVSLRESLLALAASAHSSALVSVQVDVDDAVARALDAKSAENVFYIAAGAVANVVRHARARHADVRLARDRERIVLSVADDGVGFDAQGTAHGKGLRSIEDRVRSIGATLAIDSAPGAGTRLRVDIPAVTLIA
jgi:signal transduction histidine kinase